MRDKEGNNNIVTAVEQKSGSCHITRERTNPKIVTQFEVKKWFPHSKVRVQVSPWLENSPCNSSKTTTNGKLGWDILLNILKIIQRTLRCSSAKTFRSILWLTGSWGNVSSNLGETMLWTACLAWLKQRSRQTYRRVAWNSPYTDKIAREKSVTCLTQTQRNTTREFHLLGHIQHFFANGAHCILLPLVRFPGSNAGSFQSCSRKGGTRVTTHSRTSSVGDTNPKTAAC